jgi:hypothetical protein
MTFYWAPPDVKYTEQTYRVRGHYATYDSRYSLRRIGGERQSLLTPTGPGLQYLTSVPKKGTVRLPESAPQNQHPYST